MIVSNDVLDKEDNTKMTVEVRDATIATRFGTDKQRQTSKTNSAKQRTQKRTQTNMKRGLFLPIEPKGGIYGIEFLSTQPDARSCADAGMQLG